MKFGYTIVYVEDVEATVAFYENAFDLETRMLHESELYAEMETGETTLAFAGDEMAETNGFEVRHNRADSKPAGVEIAFCDGQRANRL